MANLIDRLVLTFAPEAGARRIEARNRAQVLMNYDAASRGSRTRDWRAPGTDADAAGRAARGRLRNLTRDMLRNREYAARAQAIISGHTVGSGIVPSIECQDDATKGEVLGLVRSHLLSPSLDALGALDLFGLQRVVINTVVADGEVFVRRRHRVGPYAAGLSLPFQVELVEADLLDLSVQAHGGNRVVEGIEIGPTGAPVAYHFMSEHPGAAVSFGARGSTTRVPAADVLHVRRIDRPGQLRGVSWFAPVMLKLVELQDYQEAEIIKQKMAALMAAIVKGAEGDDQSRGIESLAPGNFVYLGDYEDIVWTDPPQVTSYDPFMKAGLRAVAMGLGITYESLSGDLENVNYSSARMGRLDMDRNVDVWQRLIMILQFCRGIERWFRDGLGVSQPRLNLRRGAWAMNWTPPRRPLIDPPKEIPAAILEVQSGLTSLQRKQREMGHDPDEIAAERAEDAARGAEFDGSVVGGSETETNQEDDA